MNHGHRAVGAKRHGSHCKPIHGCCTRQRLPWGHLRLTGTSSSPMNNSPNRSAPFGPMTCVTGLTMAVQGYKPRPSGRCRLSRATSQEQVSQGWRPQPALKPGPALALPLRYRPHPHQEKALARTFGCAHVVRNDAWARCQDLYKPQYRIRGPGKGVASPSKPLPPFLRQFPRKYPPIGLASTRRDALAWYTHRPPGGCGGGGCELTAAPPPPLPRQRRLPP